MGHTGRGRAACQRVQSYKAKADIRRDSQVVAMSKPTYRVARAEKGRRHSLGRGNTEIRHLANLIC